MVSIIVIENGAAQSKLVRAVESARATSNDVTAILANESKALLDGARIISCSSQPFNKAIESAITQSNSEHVILVDARIASFPSLKALSEQVSNDPSITLSYAPIECAGETLEIPEIATDSLIGMIGLFSELPLQCIAVRRSFALSKNIEGSSLTAVNTSFVISAASENEPTAKLLAPIRVDAALSTTELCALNDSERVALLSLAVNSCNIEDLFPNHAWSAHHEESAAAAYHSLAALFLKFGDSASASECLSLSDQLEDSPRSLALKGMLALDRGEILGAVANMVSSLQQYETRKKDSGNHYLRFEPQDLERINVKLQAGLDALNKRDNQSAFDNFAEAIFNFDDFYKNHGLDKMPSTEN